MRRGSLVAVLLLLLVIHPGWAAAASSVIDFGHVTLGTSSPTVLTLPFAVDAATTLGNIKVLTSGGANLDFTLGAGNTCTAGTTNTTCTVGVQFLPKAPGLRAGAVVLYDNSSPQLPLATIALSGFADAPVAALSPNTATVINIGTGVLNQPFQVALDGLGNIYAANNTAHNVLKVPAGGGSASVVNTGSIVLEVVTGVAIDGAGNLFISDLLNNRIVMVTADGIPSILAISGISPGLNEPAGLALDRNGTLYISDWQNNRVVEVTSLSLAASSGGTSTGSGSALIPTGNFELGISGAMGVAVDSQGTVYLADRSDNRIIKITAGGTQSLVTVSGVGALNDPRGVGVDAMDNLYIADGSNNRIVAVTTAGVASVVATPGLNLSGPFGVTADPFGNLVIPDWDNSRLVEVSVSGAALAFPSTNIGSTNGPLTATVTNIGNEPLSIPLPGSGNNPSVSANFVLDSTSTCPGRSGSTLAIGSQCTLAVDFVPTTAGASTGSVVLTDNHLNVVNTTQSVTLSAQGVQSTPTITWTAPASIAYGTALSSSQLDAGSSVPGTFTYSPAAGTVLPAGTARLSVTFTPTNTTAYTNATATASITVSQALSGIAWIPPAAIAYGTALGATQLDASSPVAGTFTYSPAAGTVLPVGKNFISATFTPTDTTDYTNASATTSITVTPAATLIALTSSSGAGGVTLTAIVSSPGGTPTGSVQFALGSTILGSGNLDANGTTALTIASLPAGTDVITITYSGSADYLSATGTASIQTVASGFTLSASPATLSVPAVGSSPVTLTVTPAGGFTGEVTFSCSGLPANEACNFSPASVRADGTNTVQTSTLTISAPQTAASFVFPGLIIGGVSRFQRRRENGRRKRKGWLVLGLLALVATVAGCGGSSQQQTNNSTYDVTVTATASGTAAGYQGQTTQTVALQVTINH